MPQQPKEILRSYWGYPHFRGSQERIIQASLMGKDVLALLPTGGGKSLCYQIPTMAKEGICMVISPLVALIQDQVENLKRRGIKAVALTGGISFEELNDLLDNCIYGNYKFLYLSPERLQQGLVRERIAQMDINIIAVDEAHCISQWGHDFRPAYLQCASVRELHPEAPIMALTATATKKVAQDIIQNLGMTAGDVIKDSFERPNIAFSVKICEDKLYQLKRILGVKNACGIVYVRSRRKTVALSAYLNKAGVTASYYHGGLTKNEKKERLTSWLANDFSVIVATNAFGMGVDKPDVRTVIHYQLPESLENYFQEAGRAGRDGKPANAVLLTNAMDKEIAQKQFLETLPNVTFIKKLYRCLNTYLQIAYGEGSGERYGFHFDSFCHRYQLHPLKTYNGLRLLDQNSVLSLSEAYGQRTTLHITAGKDVLFSYLETHKEDSKVVLTLLRTYGGIFDFETPINVFLIAKKNNMEEKKVLAVLQKLHDKEIALHKGGKEDLELTFLVPREDDKTIHRIKKNIELLHGHKSRNLSNMLDYTVNDKRCRSNVLLDYFGESAQQNCGICDICTAENRTTDRDQIERLVLQELKSAPKTARKLVAVLQIEETVVLDTIRRLLAEEAIFVNAKNEYGHIKA